MDLLKRLAAFFMMAVPMIADADCVYYWTSTTNGVVTTGNAATVCSSKNYTVGSNPTVARTYTPWANTPSLPTSSGQIGYCDEHRVNTYNDGSSSTSDTLVASSMSPVEQCSSSSSSNSCSAKAGQTNTLVFALASGPAPTELCDAGCAATVSGTGIPTINAPDGSAEGTPTGIFDVTYDGQVCGGAEPTGTEADCVVGVNGATMCATKVEGKNCGQVNGETVCVSSAEPGTCETTASGAVVCVAKTDGSTGSPPLPDDGTPGQPVEPTIEVRDNTGTGNQSNYYTNIQVGNSTVTPGSGSSSSGSSSSGSSGSSSSSSNTAGGGLTCTAPPTCSGDQILCALLAQQWRTRCVEVSEAEILSVVGTSPTAATEEVEVSQLDSTKLGLAGGSCPDDPTFQWNGQTVTIPFGMFVCDFLGQLSFFVVAMAYFLAGRVLVDSL